MNHLVDIVVAKDGQFRYRVADSIVRLMHRFRPEEVIRGSIQRLVTQIGDRAHLA
jgi:hypothetical protein